MPFPLHLRLTVALAACALAFPHLAAAQASKVAAVTVKGSQHFPSEQIAAMSGLKAGDEVTKEDIQAAADRLAQLGPFVNVQFRFRSREDTVEIEFQLEDAPTVPVAFDNFPWCTDQELTEAIRAAVPFFDGSAPEQGGVLDLMSEVLDKVLAAKNVKATIERTLIGRPDADGMMMQFRVTGASLRMKRIQFSHPLAGEDRRVRERLSDIIGKAYSRFALELFLREQVRPVYLQKGHLQVHFGTPEPKLVAEAGKPAEEVMVAVTVQPGPAYSWGGAEWTGSSVFPPAALNGYLGIVVGDLADGIRIQQALDRVRDEYGRRGYLDFKLEATPVFDDKTSRANYRVNVSEGSQYRMGQMIITGLSIAAERKLLAAWRLAQGDVFDRVYFEDFLENGVKLAFGDLPIHYDEIGRWLRQNPKDKTVDVLLDFK